MSITSIEPNISQPLLRRDLAENLRESKEYREAFVEESVYTQVAFQIRAIREGLTLSQKEFGRKVKMAQERVSILEDPNSETKPTINTLLRIANGVDCGLEVRFIPFSKVLDQSFHNSPQDLQIRTFDEEENDLEVPASVPLQRIQEEDEPMRARDISTPKQTPQHSAIDRKPTGASATVCNQDKQDQYRRLPEGAGGKAA